MTKSSNNSQTRVATLVRRSAPLLYPLLKQYPALDDEFYNAWLWLKRQRTMALSDVSELSPVQRRETKRCATEISLSILQDELEQWLAAQEEPLALRETSA